MVNQVRNFLQVTVALFNQYSASVMITTLRFLHIAKSDSKRGLAPSVTVSPIRRPGGADILTLTDEPWCWALMLAHSIFVSFGVALQHFWASKKYAKMCVNSRQNSANRPKLRTGLKKVHHSLLLLHLIQAQLGPFPFIWNIWMRKNDGQGWNFCLKYLDVAKMRDKVPKSLMS